MSRSGPVRRAIAEQELSKASEGEVGNQTHAQTSNCATGIMEVGVLEAEAAACPPSGGGGSSGEDELDGDKDDAKSLTRSLPLPCNKIASCMPVWPCGRNGLQQNDLAATMHQNTLTDAQCHYRDFLSLKEETYGQAYLVPTLLGVQPAKLKQCLTTRKLARFS